MPIELVLGHYSLARFILDLACKALELRDISKLDWRLAERGSHRQVLLVLILLLFLVC